MKQPINYLRSFGAIFISFFIMAIIDTMSASILRKLAPDQVTSPTMNQTLGVLALRVFSGFVAGYLTATLAGSRRWQHALILGVAIIAIGMFALLSARGMAIPEYSYYMPFASAAGIIIGGLLCHLKAK